MGSLSACAHRSVFKKPQVAQAVSRTLLSAQVVGALGKGPLQPKAVLGRRLQALESDVRGSLLSMAILDTCQAQTPIIQHTLVSTP